MFGIECASSSVCRGIGTTRTVGVVFAGYTLQCDVVPNCALPFPQTNYLSQVVAQGRAVTNDYVIVSAPGRSEEKGSVHVYTYSDTDERWSLLQTVTSELWSLGKRQNTTTQVASEKIQMFH